MVNSTIETDVDKLIGLLKEKGQMSLGDAAKNLRISPKIVQSWVDFLVEEKILGIDYKFTTPFIYLNAGENALTKRKKEEFSVSLRYFKDHFEQKARENKIPETKIRSLWENHLANKLELVKSFFFQEARRRSFSDVNALWDEYKDEVLLR
ncbi:hypothetical protein C4573_02000 [Candidatus Woesearchaeota archaeon]|nr:MAG: hypothetical protein C4573_02000 [Candidatus Woesearchaeota archaeon]